MTRAIVHVTLLILLTLLTQIGGFAYAVSLVAKRFVTGGRFVTVVTLMVVFAGSYAVLWLATGAVATLQGRTALPCVASADTKLVMQSPLYCILNRHYVTPSLKKVAFDLATHVDQVFPGTLTLALDANFPLSTPIPMLPHLSHGDGKKLDLAFYYRAVDGRYLRGATRSPIGYWGFETPDRDDVLPCVATQGPFTLRWDMSWFKIFNSEYDLDGDRTRAALSWLATQGRSAGVTKVLIEPYLARRLNVRSRIIRFQGCRAARHDDHMHIEIR